MAVKRNYRINFRNYGNPPAVMVSQYDENYSLTFEVYDGPLPASGLNTYAVKLVGTRADTLKYSFDGTVTGVANNVLNFTIDTTMTACAGKGVAEIVILDATNDVKFASFNLPVYVEKAAVPDDAVDADVERAQEIAEQVEELIDGATEGAEAWAVGQRGGVDVESTDPTYHNNSKYYAEQAQDIADSIGIDATLSISGKAADAKKTGDEISSLKEDLNGIQTATSSDVGKALKAKTVTDGKVTEWEFGTVGSSADATLDPTSENPVQNKTLYNELNILTSTSEDVTYVNDDRSTPNQYSNGIASIEFPTTEPLTLKTVDVYAATGASVMLALWSFRRFSQDPSSASYNRGYFTLIQILDEVTSVDNHAVFTLDDLSYDPTSLERVLIASCATSKIGVITNVSNELMPLSDTHNYNFNSTAIGDENPQLLYFRDPTKSYTIQPAYSVTYSQGGSTTATPVKTVVESLDDDMTAIRTATASDEGKALKAKTITDGKVTEWEFGDTGGSDYEESYTVNDAETTYLSAGKHNVDGMDWYYAASCDAPTYGTHSVSRIELHVGTNGETIVFGLWQFRAIQSYPTYKRGYWSLVSVLGSVVSADYKAVFVPSSPVTVDGTNQRIIATCTNKVISYRKSNFTPNPYKYARIATSLAVANNNDFSNIAVGEESALLTNLYDYMGWDYKENNNIVSAYEITYTPTVPETITEKVEVKDKINITHGALDGLVWYCAGDSVTDGDSFSYADVIAGRNNITLWRDGIGGSTMTDGKDTKTMNAFCFDRYLNIPSDVNIVTIWFGINDTSKLYTVGTIDSTDDSTFYGAYNKVLTWIINNRPLARVGLVVTHKASADIQTAIRNLAKKYGFLTFDIPNSPDIPFWHPLASYYANDVPEAIKTLRTTQWWAETTMANPTHPSADGHRAISYALEKWIMGL